MFGVARILRNSTMGSGIMPDQEVIAMAAMSDALSSLDPETRSRAIRWAAEKYGVPLSALPLGANGAGVSAMPLDSVPEIGVQASIEAPRSVVQSVVLPATFEHFADLFNAVEPKSVMDKALAAAYWHHVVIGRADWESATLNVDLRDLGHKIPAINRALDSAIQRRPALVVQLKKSGSARQARKIYKLTTEGINYIRARTEQGR
jgi:hypothetical protein